MKIERSTIFIGIILTGLLVIPTLVKADEATDTATTNAAFQTYSAATDVQKLPALKSYVQLLSLQRLNSLKALKTEATANKRLSNDDRNYLNLEIDNQTKMVAQIQGQIANSTTLDLLRDKVSQIYALEIYKTIVPKIKLEMADYRLDFEITKLINLNSKAEATMAQMKVAGKDITRLQPLIVETKKQLGDAKSGASSARSNLKSIYAGNVNNNPIRESVRSSLETSKSNLTIAIKNLKGIAVLLAAAGY